MKLSDWTAAETAVVELTALQGERHDVIATQALGVTIRGQYLDEEMLEAVRAVVIAELDRRIALRRNELLRLGVDPLA